MFDFCATGDPGRIKVRSDLPVAVFFDPNRHGEKQMTNKKKKQNDSAHSNRPTKLSDNLELKRQAIIEAVLTRLDSEHSKPTAQELAALALDDRICDSFRTMMDRGDEVVRLIIPLNKGIATIPVSSATLRQIVGGRDSYPMEMQIHHMYEHFCRAGTLREESQEGEK